MYKMIFGFAFLLNMSATIAMKSGENPFLAKNAFGMTPLHCTPILLESMTNSSDLPMMDLGKAKLAATLIMKAGADVNDADNSGKTPMDYAEANKIKLPKVYEVMKAGKIKQDTEKKLPQPDKDGVFDIQKLLEFGKSRTAAEIDYIGWQEALNTLDKYIKELK